MTNLMTARRSISKVGHSEAPVAALSFLNKTSLLAKQNPDHTDIVESSEVQKFYELTISSFASQSNLQDGVKENNRTIVRLQLVSQGGL